MSFYGEYRYDKLDTKLVYFKKETTHLLWYQSDPWPNSAKDLLRQIDNSLICNLALNALFPPKIQ